MTPSAYEDIILDSRQLADDDGLRLRAEHFPFRLDHLTPPNSAGFTIQPRPIDTLLKNKNKREMRVRINNNSNNNSPNNRSRSKLTTSKMMIDYPTESKRISAKLLLANNARQLEEQAKRDLYALSSPRTLNNTTLSPRRKKLPSMPPPPPLLSSFYLSTQFAPDQDLHPEVYFDKEDKAEQTDVPVIRQDMNIAAYQTWSSKTVEPFFKELRKAVKAQRPASVEEYVIAFCLARLHGKAEPETISPLQAQTISNQQQEARPPASSS
eukprot:gene8850-9759_t